MENKKLGQEPAYPCEIGFENGNIQEMHQNGNYTALHNGMSKRFYAACCAMQGILANPHFRETAGNNPIVISELSFEIADELLKQESL